MSGPAVALLSTSPSYVGESTPSSDDTSDDARLCFLPATPALAPALFEVLFLALPPASEELACTTEIADALLSVSGSLSSSEAS